MKIKNRDEIKIEIILEQTEILAENMNLLPVFEDNEIIILNKETFEHLYEMDTLGKSITNINSWLAENFNLPNRFTNGNS